MMAMLRAPLIGGILLALGSIVAGAFSLPALAWDISAQSLCCVVLVVAFHCIRQIRRGLLLFALNRSRRTLPARCLGGAVILSWPALMVAGAILEGSRRISGPIASGVMAAAIVGFSLAVILVAETVIDRRRRCILVACCALGAVLCTVANHSLYAAQYPIAHLVLSVVAMGCAAFCPIGVRWDAVIRTIGLVIFAAAILACALQPFPFLPRSPGERVFAAARSWIGSGAGPIDSDPEIFSRRLGPQRTDRLGELLQKMGAQKPKRILWITIDALRNDRCGFGGHAGDTTPNMDRLAEQSTVFDRCYSQGSDSLGSILSSFSGRYPAALNFRRMAEGLAPVEQKNIAEVLSARGYMTIGLPAYESDLLLGTFLPFRRGFREWSLPKGHDQRTAADGVQLAHQALVSTRGRSALIWLHFMEVHGPYPNQSGPFGNNPSKQYNDALRLVDEELGALFDRARSDGDLDDTAIVIHGDHGEEFGEHGGRYHGSTLFEESIHVPLLLHLPGQETGHHTDDVTGLINLTPTLLDCLEIESPTTLQGESLLPIMAGEGATAGFALAQLATPFGGRWSAVIDGDRKAIQNDRTRDAVFFDLSGDAGELDPAGSLFTSSEIDELRHQLVSAMEFARIIPDSRPFVPPPPTAPVQRGPGIDPLKALPLRQSDYRANHPELFKGTLQNRRAAFDSMPLLTRGEAVRELLLNGSDEARLWMLANLLNRSLSDDWVGGLLLMLAEVDDPLLIPLFNWRRHISLQLKQFDSMAFARLVKNPQRLGGPPFLTKIFRTQGVQARADALHLMHQMGDVSWLLDKWWDAGKSVSRASVKWEQTSLDSASRISRMASAEEDLLVIRIRLGEGAALVSGDPIEIRAHFLDVAGTAISKQSLRGVADIDGHVVFGCRPPELDWVSVRLVGREGHALPEIMKAQLR